MDNPEHEMIDELQFTCPRCGGHEFGSAWSGNGNIKDMTTWEGCCHGYVEQPSPGGSRVLSQRSCGFLWNRKDDAKYMHPTGRKQPKYGIGMVSTPVRP